MTLHFDQIKNQVISLISRISTTGNYNKIFIVRDVFGRISIYTYTDDNNVASVEYIKTILMTNIGPEWIQTVENISDNILLQQLINSTQVVYEGGNIFFGERHLTRLNWFRKIEDNYNNSNKTKIVTFYSFKGGLGRTTSLVLTALQLARQGKKLVLIDFDLEAPGLSSLLPPESEMPGYGVVDYLLESNIYKNSNSNLDINEYVYSFRDKQLIGNNGGQIYVFPAAKLTSENSEEYLEKMGRIDFGTPSYQNHNNPISKMLDQITEKFSPDFVFLDARTGINDVGGLTLTNYTDLACLIFYGSDQNLAGMKIVLPRILESDVPFLLINTPVPITEEESKEEVELYLECSYNLLIEKGYYSEANIPDIYDESADHYPINISYDNYAVLLNSNNKLKRLLDNSSRNNSYLELAEQITSFYGDETSTRLISIDDDRDAILTTISEIMNGNSAASENEFISQNDLYNKFYPMREHRFIFDPDKFLILGPKGSGKTALFSVLEHTDYARSLASYLGVTTDLIESTYWITGLKQSKDFPSSQNFESVGNEDNVSIFRRYWRLLAVRSILNQVSSIIPRPSEELITEINAPNSELRQKSKDVILSEKIEEYFTLLDQFLEQKKQRVMIIYDGLDVLLKNNPHRGKMISALISLWYEYISRFQNIRVKIFLREDIFQGEVHDITDKVKLGNYSEKLSWNYESLLAMVYKRMVQRSDDVANLFKDALKTLGLAIPSDERVGYVPRADTESNKAILKILFGERLGSGKAAFSYNWIRNHLADTNDQIVPRSILTLFASAARKELEQPEFLPYPVLIKSKNLQRVMVDVSIDRVTDLLEEYEEYKKIFSNLKEYLPTFPANEQDLKVALNYCGVPEKREQSTIDELVKIGVMKPYQRKKSDPVRYHIPDIFLIGLGLARKGLKAHR